MNYTYLNSRPLPLHLHNYHREAGDILYVDIETYGVPPHDGLDLLTAQPRLLQILGENSDEVLVFDLQHIPLEECLQFLEGKTLVGHNVAFDLAILHRLGLAYPENCRCTMVANQILVNGLDPIEFSSSLVNCCKYYLKREINKELQTSDWQGPQLSPEQIQYAADDVFHTRDLDRELLIRLDKWGLKKIAELEWAIIPAIVEMKLQGVGVDRATWLERSQRAVVKANGFEVALLAELPSRPLLEEKAVRIRKKDGEPFPKDLEYNQRVREENLTRKWNLGSWQQLLEVFGKLGIKLKDTSYETLVEAQLEHPILSKLLSWKDVYKESTTFGEEWLKHIREETGRVHPDWRQIGPATGRMACAEPNMQQLPRGELRKGIVAGEGKLLVKADFSQIEARIAAKVSGDQTLIDLFQKGGDIHVYAAKAVLQKEEVTKEERQIGKSLLFGLLFGLSAKNLRVYCQTNYGVKMTGHQAEVFRKRFFRAFPGLQRWHGRAAKICEAKEDFRSLLGRRRYVRPKSPKDCPNKYGIELNHPVQSSAADLLKMSVREVWQQRGTWEGKMGVLMLVHDEIVLEVEEGVAEEVGVWLRGLMIECGSVLLNPIPCDAEVRIGKSWGG